MIVISFCESFWLVIFMKHLYLELENLILVAVDKFHFRRFWYKERCFSGICFPKMDHFSVCLVTLDYRELEITFDLSKDVNEKHVPRWADSVSFTNILNHYSISVVSINI